MDTGDVTIPDTLDAIQPITIGIVVDIAVIDSIGIQDQVIAIPAITS